MGINATPTRRKPTVWTHPESTDPVIYSVIGAQIPATLWVRPAGGSWTVEYSVDGGQNFQTLANLTGATGFRDTIMQSAVTHIRVTASGTAGGTLGYV